MYLITLQQCLPLGACCACCTCRLIDTPQSSIWHKHTALLLVPSQLGPGQTADISCVLGPCRSCRPALDQRPHVSEQLEGPDFLPPGGRCGRAHPFCWLALLSARVALREGLARRRLAGPGSGTTVYHSASCWYCDMPLTYLA